MEAGCRWTSRILLGDSARGLVAAVSIVDVDGAESVKLGFGDFNAAAAALRLPAGSTAALGGPYRDLTGPGRGRASYDYGRRSSWIRIVVAGPPGDGDPAFAGTLELDRWIAAYHGDLAGSRLGG